MGKNTSPFVYKCFHTDPHELNSSIIMKQRRPRPSFTMAFTLRLKKPHHTKSQIGFFWMNHKGDKTHLILLQWTWAIYFVWISNHLLLPPPHYLELKLKSRIKLFFFDEQTVETTMHPSFLGNGNSNHVHEISLWEIVWLLNHWC